MKNCLLSVIVLFLTIPFSGLAQSVITLYPTKDAAIGYHDGANTANNNYGAAIQNAAYAIPSVAAPVGLNVNRALIDFDLSAIPAGATIISAQLSLYALGPFGSLPGHTGSNNHCYLERVVNSWSEYTVSWNNQPSSTALNRVILVSPGSATQDYLHINVTKLVRDMINNPASSYGFLLKLISESATNALAFASKEHSNKSLTPALTITYQQNCSKTDTLIADYDAAIGYHNGANTANSNYGTAQQNAAYAIPSAAMSGGLNVNRALIHFNLGSIPPGAVITDARLDLFAYGPVSSYPGHGGSANNGVIERVTGTWTENTVSWNTQPNSTPVNQVPVTGTSNATLDYMGINVTPIISDIHTLGVNNGMMLKLVAENPTNLLFFCSKDNPNPSKHPRLRVSYTCLSPSSVKEANDPVPTVICFPNPAKNYVNFRISSPFTSNAGIRIYDAMGKLVYEHLYENNEINPNGEFSINAEALVTGIYFYSIQIGKYTQTGKFMIE